jgi:hypothetical protein
MNHHPSAPQDLPTSVREITKVFSNSSNNENLFARGKSQGRSQ